MSDPTPVPLDEIEDRPLYYSDYDGSPWVKLPLAERDALCEALRIAVEGLEPFEEFDGTLAAAALAAVRELVDLGEKP